MASVKNSDIPEAFNFMGDFWVFMKNYYVPDKDDAYWEAVIADAADLGHKYKDDRLAVHLINAYLDYLEEKLKNTQKGNKYGS